jgi:hypothetical protein
MSPAIIKTLLNAFMFPSLGILEKTEYKIQKF